MYYTCITSAIPLLLPEKLSPEAIIGGQARCAFAQGLAREGVWKSRAGDHSPVRVRRVFTLGVWLWHGVLEHQQVRRAAMSGAGQQGKTGYIQERYQLGELLRVIGARNPTVKEGSYTYGKGKT